jgi:LmbE family N-acetylglucosaminyl deacetylase
MIAKIYDKERVNIIYATDGMKSPEPLFPWRDKVSPDLGQMRMQEARLAMGYLGVPQENIHFWVLPEGRLNQYIWTMHDLLIEFIDRLEPAHILVPFRYDRHVDHIALNRVITRLYGQQMNEFELIEYFVYYQWRLLPMRDVRKYIYPQYLFRIDIADVSVKKRIALDFFRSQTTRFFAWQTRPNLTPQLLDSVSQAPEFFLRFDSSIPGPKIFRSNATWIRVAHRLEPALKRKKDQAVAVWRRGYSSIDHDRDGSK